MQQKKMIESPDLFEEMNNETEKSAVIPENELEIKFVTSGGPGGQHLNKSATAAQLRWNIGLSRALSEEEKARIREGLSTRITESDEIILKSSRTRSQKQNREDVIERLNLLVSKALAVSKERRPTRPTRVSKERRLASKKRHSQLKTERRLIKPYEIS